MSTRKGCSAPSRTTYSFSRAQLAKPFSRASSNCATERVIGAPAARRTATLSLACLRSCSRLRLLTANSFLKPVVRISGQKEAASRPNRDEGWAQPFPRTGRGPRTAHEASYLVGGWLGACRLGRLPGRRERPDLLIRWDHNRGAGGRRGRLFRLGVVVARTKALQPLSLGDERTAEGLGQLDIIHRHDPQPRLELPHLHFGIRQF